MKALGLVLCLLLFAGQALAQCAQMDASEAPTGSDVVDASEVPYDRAVTQLVAQLNSLYGLKCEYLYFDDSAGHNCYANQADGKLYLGVNMLGEITQSNNSLPGMCYVIAHEMGHAYQFAHSQSSLLNCGRYGELQADFLAGYALARLGYVGPGTYRQVLGQAWAIGDPTGAWQNPQAHGTSGERSADTSIGISHRTDVLSTAYRWSGTYLPPRGRCGEGSSPQPPKERVSWLVALDNGQRLRVMYGGAITDGNGRQVGQLSTYGGTPYFLLNFTKEGTLDLLADPATNLLYWVGELGRPVGRYQLVGN